MSTDATTDPGLEERIETLTAETERLRAQLEAAHRRRYRNTAAGLGAVGAIALLGAAAIPELRVVLVALGAAGVFAGLLTYTITPERFVSADVGTAVYRALADNERAIVEDLDLRGDPVVVPASGSASPARLFVPLTRGDDYPSEQQLLGPFVTEKTPGLVLTPTGGELYASLAEATALPDSANGIATAVGEALLEQFELIDAVDVDVESGRVTMAVDGSAYGRVDRFDHPVPSLLATALAVELETPVRATVEEGGDSADWLVTCLWESQPANA